MPGEASLLGRRMTQVGWACAVGIALVLFDLLALLRSLPAAWWFPDAGPQVTPSGIGFDLRLMEVHFGLAWLGAWGYLVSLLWLPVAVTKLVRARSRTERATTQDRLVILTVALLLGVTTALHHLTPLRYPGYNIPLL